MVDGVIFRQKETWEFENVKLIRERPSCDSVGEDTYYGLEFLGRDKIIWLNRDAGNEIDGELERLHINLEEIRVNSLYDFDCKCEEGLESYKRHGEGRCDGCHGRIFK